MASEGIMATNDDASVCKRYATHKKYWRDDFVQYFVRNVPPRKAPEINRGYYLRHYGISSIVKQFLSMTKNDCQIVSLGCGFDSLFWNLYQQEMLPAKGFYEIDMKPIVQKKIQFIKTRPPLYQMLKGEMKVTSDQLHSQDYHLMSCDLKTIQELKNILFENGVDKDTPTLFIAECVFVYIELNAVTELLNFIGQDFKNCMLVDYDPVNLNDRFGEVMKQNLKVRDCFLLGAHDTIQSKIKTYSKFQNTTARLLVDIYNDLPQTERTRVDRIEFLDEIDLLFDLLKHYCICLASNDGNAFGFADIIV